MMETDNSAIENVDERIGVDAVERALTILNALGESQNSLSLKEVALKTGLSKPTILRLSVSLERFGYLRRSGSGTYSLGPTLWKLGSAYRRNLELEPIVRPALQALVALTQESASFWIRREKERVCLFRVNSPRSARSHVEEGETSPLDKGSGGHVISHGFGLSTPFGAEIAADQVVATLGDRDPDVASVSAPVYGPNGEFTGAITLAGILSRFAPQVPEFKVVVRQAAMAVSRQLGGDFPKSPAASPQK
jgi:DNA-binding IclR family transcriptional regulator